jgi:hypothetical protein
MTTNLEIPKGTSLTVCALKKSADIITRYSGLWTCLFVGVISILGIALAMWQYSDQIYPFLLGGLSIIGDSIRGIFYSIPWYVYVLIAIPVSLYTYSGLWCIQRTFRDNQGWLDINSTRIGLYSGVAIFITMIIIGASLGGLAGALICAVLGIIFGFCAQAVIDAYIVCYRGTVDEN